jgi:hypothetical protein
MSNIDLLPTFKAQAIVDVYNFLAESSDKPKLADWSKAKSELVARICNTWSTTEIERAIALTEDGPRPGKKGKVDKAKAPKKPKAKAEKKADGEKKPRAQGVGAFIRQTLVDTPDMKAADVISLVQKKWPEAKTSIACVGWYRSKMYKTGELERTTKGE